jgi:hypothetical protein
VYLFHELPEEVRGSADRCAGRLTTVTVTAGIRRLEAFRSFGQPALLFLRPHWLSAPCCHPLRTPS